MSWGTVDWPDPFLLHVKLAVVGVVVLGVGLAWKGPFLRFLLMGCGGMLVSLTAYSWFYYPNLVILKAEDVANSRLFCIYFDNQKSAAHSLSDLTFLTIPKGKHVHFTLNVEKEYVGWSFHQRQFDPDQLSGQAEWTFEFRCSGKGALGMAATDTLAGD